MSEDQLPYTGHEMQKGVSLISVCACLFAVALPVALFWPVYAKSGRPTPCMNNARQLAMGVLMYSNDADDVLPPARRRDGVLWPSLLKPYERYSGVWTCPEDKGATNSYGLNEMVFVDFTDYSAKPQISPSIDSIASAAKTIMLGEVGTGDDLKTDRKNAYKLTPPDGRLHDQFDARPAARHKEQCNVVPFDGHAAARRLNQFYTGQTPADRWFCRDASQTKMCFSDR